jgi:uncharacterized membrane protein
MRSRWHFELIEFSRKLWVRATFFSVLAVVSAILSAFLAPYLPEGIEARIGAGAVDSILNIIASSMLVVTTFSLSTMVAAYAASTNTVTPRATSLLMTDTTTQNALATFLGSFLFSLVGIIALAMGLYGDEGRVVLFVFTLLVVLLIVATLLRWIDYLSRLGRVNETTRTVEEAARKAMEERRDRPHLGATPLADIAAIPATARDIAGSEIGYVRHVDMERLCELAEEAEADIFIVALPGAFVHPARPLVRVTGEGIDAEAVREAFTVGDERSFAQDPLFGLAVMAEIASRALSPALNDPGTAIDVLGRSVRLIAIWSEEPEEPPQVLYPRVHAPGIPVADCLDHVFNPIGRDGAAMAEVQIRIMKSLRALAEIDPERFGPAVRRQVVTSWRRAAEKLTLEEDRARVLEIARETNPSIATSGQTQNRAETV